MSLIKEYFTQEETVRLHGAPCSSLDGVTACMVYTADSIRKFDSKSNRTADSIRDSIRMQKTIRRSLVITSADSTQLNSTGQLSDHSTRHQFSWVGWCDHGLRSNQDCLSVKSRSPVYMYLVTLLTSTLTPRPRYWSLNPDVLKMYLYTENEVCSSRHSQLIRRRIVYTLSIIVYKCLYGAAPFYLMNLCVLVATNTSRRYLRSATHGDLMVPRTRTVTYGPQSFFAVSGPTVWNTLPSTLRASTTTFGQFQSGLKTTLFCLAYGTWLGALVTV